MQKPPREDQPIEIPGRLNPELLREITELVTRRLSELGLAVEAGPAADKTRADIVVRDGAGERVVLQVRSEKPGNRIDEMRERLAEVRKRNEHTGRELERLRKKIAAA